MTYPKMHASLYVSDMLETVNFYCKLFDQDPSKIKANYSKWILETPSLIISFIENAELVKPTFGHLGFQLATKEELELAKSRILKTGLSIREEIGTHCCFAVQDKFWVLDPDGVQWEFYIFKEDVEFNDPHYSSGDASACCSL